MSVEEQARLASSELRSSVARAVSTTAARGELSRRLRRRRVEHGVLAVLCIAAVTGAAAALVQQDADSALPATIPTVDRDASPAADCLFTVTCNDGVYRAALTVPVTFRTAGLVDVVSDTTSVLELGEPSLDVGVTVVANPGFTAGDVAAAEAAGSLPSSSALVASLLARPDLTVTPPVQTLVGGRPALQVDIKASGTATYVSGCPVANDGCVPLVNVEGRAGELTRVGLARGESVRLSLVDVPGEGTVAVLVRDRVADGRAPTMVAVRLLPVVDSLAFGRCADACED